MAIKDAVITLKGDQAKVRKIEIMRKEDGTFEIAVFGETKDSLGRPVGLDRALVERPASAKVLSDVWDAALPILRVANDLE